PATPRSRPRSSTTSPSRTSRPWPSASSIPGASATTSRSCPPRCRCSPWTTTPPIVADCATSAPTTTPLAGPWASSSTRPCPTGPPSARHARLGWPAELPGTKAPADVNDIKPTPDMQTYGKFKLHKTYVDQPVGYQKAVENARDALTDLKDEKNLVMVGLWAYN